MPNKKHEKRSDREASIESATSSAKKKWTKCHSTFCVNRTGVSNFLDNLHYWSSLG
ncbi:hypothetical protein RchiOBHm_Chr5g0033221 [Rosa chinensis]|uniref:Uncharacterized protein n=1 Tax=Rosa chinensis TaxID=74649 RepID=A0A2P6QAP8_ROSCH|nr:hypothetical protein RchiOBHm_Chr5g0033221 [Rosa chinensis]